MFEGYPDVDGYEHLGSKVFNMWDSINAELPPSHSSQSGNPIGRLHRIVTSPIQNLPPGWEEELSLITSSMTAVDYALHGKKIADFFLRLMAYEEAHGYLEAPARRSGHATYGGASLGASKSAGCRPFPQWLPTNRDSDK
jgi:hypothetical protein